MNETWNYHLFFLYKILFLNFEYFRCQILFLLSFYIFIFPKFRHQRIFHALLFISYNYIEKMGWVCFRGAKYCYKICGAWFLFICTEPVVKHIHSKVSYCFPMATIKPTLQTNSNPREPTQPSSPTNKSLKMSHTTDTQTHIPSFQHITKYNVRR